MRLIDADTLLDRIPKVDLDHEEKITRSGAIMDMICMVDTAPTVEVPRWIPVTPETMPPDRNEVFAYRPSMALQVVTTMMVDSEWLRYGKNLRGEDVITHWMPIPEPPEVEDTTADNAEHCVCCDAVIPEGRQVCPACESGG